MTESPLVDSSFDVPVFSSGDDPIACLNKAMAFLTSIASSRFPSTNNKLRTSSNLRNQATIQDGIVIVQQVQGRQGQSYSGTGYKSIPTSSGGNNASGQARTEDLDTYDSDCDDISNAKAVLMDNISNYGSDVISEVPHSKTYLNDMENQGVHAMQDFEQPPAVDFIGYQNPFHLKKAQRIKPTLYDGIVISNKHVAMPVIDDEETLILEEKSRSKILSEDFGKRFTPQQEMDAEQAFWFRISNPTIKSSSPPPVKVEVPSELPKKRTTPDARTEDIFNVFDRDLLNQIMEVQTAFDQMDVVVQQFSVNKQCLKIAKKELFLENDRLLQQIMSHDVLLTVMNSMSLIGESVIMERKRKESCDKRFNLEAELLKSQNAFNDLLKRYSQLERHCISLESSIQLNQVIFQKGESCDNQNALEIPEFFENNDLKAQLQDKEVEGYYKINERKVFREQFNSIKKTCVHTKEHSNSLIDKMNLKSAENEDLKAQIQDKVFVIMSLKNDLQKVKGKEIIDIVAQIPSANTIAPGMFKLDLEPLAPRLLQNREVHIEYLKYAQEQADILREIVEQAKAKQPLDKELDIARKHAQRIQELVIYVQDTFPNAIKLNEKKVAVTPKNKVKKVRIEVFYYHAKSAKKHKKWKPTGHVFTKVGLKWKPTGKTSTIVGNSCPLTRITSANVVPPKKTISHSVETQKPDLKVYNRKPKNVKNVGSSKKAKIVESKNANHSKPNHIWGSNATDIPSSSSLVMTGCPDCSLVSGLWMFKTHDKEPLSSHELSSKNKSWLWHRRLSHLNFGTINKLAKDGLARGIPILKFHKDHLCSARALGKSKKSSHQPKAKDTNQEKLYLLHMDLCGLMHMASINGKRYILVIVDDYSRFTWVGFFRTMDEAPEAIFKCIKNIQVRLNVTVRNVRTDNGTEFVYQTLR
ncbi:integrase, catalytic region, zinc finger, CCHC-type containing protein [Tanacetum coccineum]